MAWGRSPSQFHTRRCKDGSQTTDRGRASCHLLGGKISGKSENGFTDRYHRGAPLCGKRVPLRERAQRVSSQKSDQETSKE